MIVKMRKTNHSIYEISEILKSHDQSLSPTAVREVLKVEGFAALPRRLDEERPDGLLRPTIEAVADVRRLSLAPRRFETMCGGLFLFVPGIVALDLQRLDAMLARALNAYRGRWESFLAPGSYNAVRANSGSGNSRSRRSSSPKEDRGRSTESRSGTGQPLPEGHEPHGRRGPPP